MTTESGLSMKGGGAYDRPTVVVGWSGQPVSHHCHSPQGIDRSGTQFDLISIYIFKFTKERQENKRSPLMG
jgi:hypothetical protein